ncbi:MAG: hypothetical protein CMJ86_06160 [Planctomycetes bacterium]|nr:hypothetical protein [Planctomycetota bacterium]
MKRALGILFCCTLVLAAGLGVAVLQATVHQDAGELDRLTKESEAFELKRAHLEEENARIELGVREQWNATEMKEGEVEEL